MKFNLAGVLGSVLLATDDEGSSFPGHANRIKTATKAKRMVGDKNASVSVGRSMEDDHIDLTRSTDPMHADDDHTVLTLEDSLVKAYKCMVTDLEVVEDEKSKEIHHLKKKNSSLRKSYEALEARVKEREEEIDNLQSALARAQHDAVESYKASSEYQHDLYTYGAESISASISLTKDWISTKHPGVNLQGFDHFLALRRDLDQAAEQDRGDDQADTPLQDEDGASHLD
ncbi:Uncharacterized protein Adt_27124 [Abeliophyllum distichum]|uniref:Uncharacterized protein n=1 Tax=Abeliophyllum distichum TaxID=126358 RepID=A0ABD1RSV0_9LAMI